jgi:hypothetical protein
LKGIAPLVKQLAGICKKEGDFGVEGFENHRSNLNNELKKIT